MSLVTCIFGNQYIMGIVFSCSFKVAFFAVFMSVSIISFLHFCVCKYGDADYLFLFGESSINSLEM